jgi:DNA-binding FadR family transcriptional regulator
MDEGNGARQRNPRLRHVRVADTLAADLRRRILNGEYNGRLLPTQHELQEQTQVGLTSIREAMRILEAEGLITIRRGNQGGAEVHTPDVDSAAFSLGLALQGASVTVDDLGQALRFVEPTCARLCASSSERAMIAEQLNVINDKAETAVKDDLGDVAFTHLARQFHGTMVALCSNRSISLVVQSMVGLWTMQEELWAQRVSYVGTARTAETKLQVIAAHRGIVSKIANADETGAERLSRKHLEASQQYLLHGSDGTLIDITRT